MGTTEKSKQMASKESLNNAVQTRPKATLYEKEDKKNLSTSLFSWM